VAVVGYWVLNCLLLAYGSRYAFVSGGSIKLNAGMGQKHPVLSNNVMVLAVFCHFLRGYMSEQISIVLNGEDRLVESRTLADLVDELGLQQRMIAIERNLEVVPKSQYGSTLIEDNDRIELVHMIGGG
jgi:sulfur carrier protein